MSQVTSAVVAKGSGKKQGIQDGLRANSVSLNISECGFGDFCEVADPPAVRHLRHGSLGTHIQLFADISKYLNSDIQPVPGIRLFYIVKICK